jgi:hypothetical protein
MSLIFTGLILGLTTKIWYPHKIGFHHQQLEVMTLIIIIICGYLAALKLTEYLADFKDIKHKSRIEILFLTVFFTMLFIPMSHISNKDISKSENRALAKYQPLTLEQGRFNYNYGKDFDAWFSDRFALRKPLIKFYNHSLLSSKPNKKYIKDENSLFLYNWYEVILPSKQNVLKGLHEAEKFQQMLAEHNIKMYILLVPQKAQIYNPSDRKIIDKDINKAINKINRTTNLKIIYPLNELKEASKKDYVYFKTDHHWTDYGAFVGYQKLMKEIKKDYPNVKITSESDFDYFYRKDIRSDFLRDFHIGRTCTNFVKDTKECKKSLDVNYKYFRHKDIEKLTTETHDEQFHREKTYFYPNGSNLRTILLGTSMGEDLTESLPYSFKYTYRLRNNNVKDMPTDEEFKIVKYYKDKILNYKPDILILCITVNNIPRLTDLFKE